MRLSVCSLLQAKSLHFTISWPRIYTWTLLMHRVLGQVWTELASGSCTGSCTGFTFPHSEALWGSYASLCGQNTLSLAPICEEQPLLPTLCSGVGTVPIHVLQNKLRTFIRQPLQQFSSISEAKSTEGKGKLLPVCSIPLSCLHGSISCVSETWMNYPKIYLLKVCIVLGTSFLEGDLWDFDQPKHSIRQCFLLNSDTCTS